MTKFIASWFFVGFVPYAPGTVGTLAALPFAWVIQTYMGNYALYGFTLIFFFIGWWATHRYMKATGKHDPKEVVIDEVVGIWLLLSVFPVTIKAYFFAFTFFRIFDVLKPFPVSLPDKKMDSALGVMLDDVLAGLYPFALFTIAMIGLSFFGMGHLPFKFIDFLME